MKATRKIIRKAFFVLVMCSPLSTTIAAGQTLFSDDFEGPQWVGKDGGAHNGVVVDDPLRAENRVLTFTALNSGGDIFGSEVTVTPGQTYVLSFEYLGRPGFGGVPDDLGGFIGFADDTPGFHRWLAGTIVCCGNDDPLIDDDQWRTYTIEFDPFVDSIGNPLPPSNNTIRAMLEDFSDSGGVAGDVFFDNVQIRTTMLEIEIDIKPGSDSNPNNPRSKGKIPVAILMTDDFNPWDVDPSTIAFGPDGASVAHSRVHAVDVDRDGDIDMVVHFKTRETGIACGDTEATLTGQTFDGTAFEGTDSVQTVGCHSTELQSMELSRDENRM